MGIIKELWNDGPCGIAVLLLGTVVATIAGWITVIMIDQFGIDHNERVEIVGHHYEPAHTIMVTVSSGKTTTVVPQYVPDAWELIVSMDGGNYKCASNSFWYSRYIQGQVDRYADSVFTTGLITGYEYCSELTPTMVK